MKHSDLEWFVPLSVAAALQLSVASLLAARGIGPAPALGGYWILALTGLTLVWVGAMLFKAATATPLASARAFLAANRSRMAFTTLAVLVGAVGAASFGSIKSSIPVINGFWLDPWLATAEATLFGTDPWRVSHTALGWATPAIDLLYAAWLLLQMLIGPALLLLPPSGLKSRALITHALAWPILGLGLAVPLASVGPVYFDRVFHQSHFADFSLAGAPIAARTTEMLWQAYVTGSGGVGDGISAMPSLHVAMSLWLALILARTRFAALGWAYFVVVWIGSIHLGWHYFSDGLVGSLGLLAIWHAAPKLAFTRGRWIRPGTPSSIRLDQVN